MLICPELLATKEEQGEVDNHPNNELHVYITYIYIYTVNSKTEETNKSSRVAICTVKFQHCFKKRFHYLDKITGNHVTAVNASDELLVNRANSRTPPHLHSGPTGFIFHNISSAFPDSSVSCVM